MNNSFLAKTEYYAPFPIFKISADFEFGDANLATKILSMFISPDFLLRSIKQRHHHLHGNRANKSDVPAPSRFSIENNEESVVGTDSFRIESSQLGEIELQMTVLRLPDPVSLNRIDRTVYVEIRRMEREGIYRSKLQIALEHQLIWETYAISYDLVLQELDFYRDVVDRHCRALTAAGIFQVIDIGSGTGNVAIPLLRAERSVTAVDISRAMIDRMRSKLATQDIPRITILQQDAKELFALPDSSFDGANILLALFDMSEPLNVLNEVIRVLRLGGSLIITEPKRTFNLAALLSLAEKSLQERRIYEKLRSHWERVSKVNKKIDPSKRSTRLFAEDILEQLRSAGFSITRMEDSHHGNCSTIWAVKTRT
jgi:ubiquinone/menaquinone biosynthesis C-methylase UbiE